ncbi:MAG TPA: RsmD family RNA methyltransferase [Gemmataceae bacterium]|nr:RsmD family RNA methyltransferase [Gemmataceae bacterium]
MSGSLRGRKLTCTVSPGLRPAPDRLREALFSILGNAVPGRPFLDVFAGTGAVGFEALSRGAASIVFVERDFRTANEIERHLQAFGVADKATIVRADAYRWAERWPGRPEPVTIFLGPPYPDFDRRAAELYALVAGLQEKTVPGSVLVLQSEQQLPWEQMPGQGTWDQRVYGRNRLSIWVKEVPGTESP